MSIFYFKFWSQKNFIFSSLFFLYYICKWNFYPEKQHFVLKFLTWALCIFLPFSAQTLSGRPPPATSMGVGQFFKTKEGERVFSPWTLVHSMFSQKVIMCKIQLNFSVLVANLRSLWFHILKLMSASYLRDLILTGLLIGGGSSSWVQSIIFDKLRSSACEAFSENYRLWNKGIRVSSWRFWRNWNKQ